MFYNWSPEGRKAVLRPARREELVRDIAEALVIWALLAWLCLLAISAPRLLGAQRAPVPAREVPPSVEATIGVSAQVIAATDPLQQEPEAPVRWVVQYPYPGRRDHLTVWPEGL